MDIKTGHKELFPIMTLEEKEGLILEMQEHIDSIQRKLKLAVDALNKVVEWNEHKRTLFGVISRRMASIAQQALRDIENVK